jgi:hypothetical protein
VGRGSLLLVVGDVSTRVPAALFMARTITLLKEYAVASSDRARSWNG